MFAPAATALLGNAQNEESASIRRAGILHRAMSASPLVSVILPAYNHERFVAQAVASVLAQTLEDWELIAIDDGSTDRTREILEGFNDARIRVLAQENAGSHATINRGLQEARGEYLAILNSDDAYHPQRLAFLLARAREHGSDFFGCTAVRLIDETGAPRDDPAFWWNAMYRDILRAWDDTEAAGLRRPLLSLLWGNFAVSTSNFFFTRSVLARCGRLPHFRYVLDWAYALRVAEQMPAAFSFARDAVLLDYRLHGGNTILSGPLRNHIEAGFILRKAVSKVTDPAVHRAVWRLHYLDRFLRKQEVYTRQEALNRLAVTHELQAGKLQMTEEHVRKLENALQQRLARLEKESQQRAVKLENALQQRIGSLENALREAAALRERLEGDLAHVRRLHGESTARAQTVEARLQDELASITQQLHTVYASRSWRATAPLRRAAGQARRVLLRPGRQLLAALRRHGATGLLARVWSRSIEHMRRQELPSQAVAADVRPADTYATWVAKQDRRVRDLRIDATTVIAGLGRRPGFSVVVPVFDTDQTMLQRMLASVANQIYPHWELCIADDGSAAPHIQKTLMEAAASDSRVRVRRRSARGHICAASNSALELATGDFVVFLDHDDELAPHALLAIAQHIDAHPDTDLLYSDEDKINSGGARSLPLFKPDWSPALAWTQNYMGHLVCARTELVRRVGGFMPGMEGAQDYDLFLRLSLVAARVDHLADVLYHWRAHEGSTAMNAGAKSYAHDAGRRAVEADLRIRYGDLLLRVEDGAHPFVYSPRFALPATTLVSIIVPTKDKPELLRDCVEGILQRSAWQNYEVIIVDNNSEQRETFALFEELSVRDARVRIVTMPVPFNWSRINNRAVNEARGDVLIFLNNDTAVISTDWIERLAEVALLPDVATVGPLLLFADGTVQHAGVVVGMGGWADHLYRGSAPTHFPSPFVSAVTTRNVLANTGACLAVERSKFDALGGFDEAFTICGSDVEFGLRAHRRGWQNIYLATVRLSHFESKTRGATVPDGDFAESERKYAPYRTGGDPFFNPNLSLRHTTPGIDPDRQPRVV